ncbi:MAG: 3-methyl-2-oxobutanoate hydroxymethyltransferase [Candidatus Portnoybacteria bacterium]|nr:3-methyl-2-oxobutanoate hydroxymethyltransferase [Candidatus Portnoybacteria bacterium]
MTVNDMIEGILRKKNKRKIIMLTCYDYSFAKILDETGIDMLLVGDSLANVVLGLNKTSKVSITEMLSHTKAVAKGASKTLIVADMPYLAYQKDPKKCVYYAHKFIKQGAAGVKIEWFKECEYVVKRLVKEKIPVMGHIGLTPQTAHLLGGYKIQGKDEKSAQELIKQAETLQNLGVFCIVLECIPYKLARLISRRLKIPTIGIGAGKYCDGQVLVLYDFLGLYKGKKLKFARKYRNLSSEIKSSTLKFIDDVKRGRFPKITESF